MKILARSLATLLALCSLGVNAQKEPRSLIKGGKIVTSEEKYPYFPVVLGRREFPNEFGNGTDSQGVFCGGVLIAPDVVLTIGHCIDKTDLVAVRCIFELVDLQDTDRKTIEAKSWFIDESQDEDKALGLIFLEQEITSFAPMNVMIDNTRPLQGDKLGLMGYGHTDTNGALSIKLRDDTIEVNFTSVCNLDFNDSISNEYQFCAGGNGTGACIGDSGNPLIDDAGRIAGIVSYGFDSCGVFPTVFTRVGAYTDFLKNSVCNRSSLIDDPEWCFFREPVPQFGGDDAAGGDAGGGFFACFAGSSKVEVQTDNGRIEEVAMKDLSIGDQVNTGNDIYEPVYSFGHYSPSIKADMLQIKTDSKSTLRLSPNHILMTASNGAIPASQVKVGDQLFTSSGNVESVQKIDNVIARGMYAPFTPSGKVVVDGILASSYIALEDSDGLELMGGVLKISHQWMAHAGSFPHRMVCYYYDAKNSNYCADEKYSSEGISEGVHGSLLFYQDIFEMSDKFGPLVHGILFSLVMLGLVTFSLMETMMMNPFTSIIMFTLGISMLAKKKFECKVQRA